MRAKSMSFWVRDRAEVQEKKAGIGAAAVQGMIILTCLRDVFERRHLARNEHPRSQQLHQFSRLLASAAMWSRKWQVQRRLPTY